MEVKAMEEWWPTLTPKMKEILLPAVALRVSTVGGCLVLLSATGSAIVSWHRVKPARSRVHPWYNADMLSSSGGGMLHGVWKVSLFDIVISKMEWQATNMDIKLQVEIKNETKSLHKHVRQGAQGLFNKGTLQEIQWNNDLVDSNDTFVFDTDETQDIGLVTSCNWNGIEG